MVQLNLFSSAVWEEGIVKTGFSLCSLGNECVSVRRHRRHPRRRNLRGGGSGGAGSGGTVGGAIVSDRRRCVNFCGFVLCDVLCAAFSLRT